MNNGVSCPDCNSQDIQEKVIPQKMTTSNKNWKGFFIVLLIGLVGTVIFAGIGSFTDSGIAGIGSLLFLTSIVLGLIILFKGSVKDKDTSYHYYICRSCGREFHNS